MLNKMFSRLFILLLPCLLCQNYSFSQAGSNLKYAQGKTNLGKYLDEKKWNELFPNRDHSSLLKKQGKSDFYSYKAFKAAAEKFSLFLGEGEEETQKRELCAFLAYIAQETSGGWYAAPGGYYRWGLFYVEEQGCETGCRQYSDTSNKEFFAAQNVSYHGRGPGQLSWNFNYGQFSLVYYGAKDTLLSRPDLLNKDAVLSFASAIWFWMSAQTPKPSCHDIICNKWTPTVADLQNGRMPGFGATVNVINGGIECGKPAVDKTKYRYEFYKYFCRYFKVSPGDNIECTTQKPFTVQ